MVGELIHGFVSSITVGHNAVSLSWLWHVGCPSDMIVDTLYVSSPSYRISPLSVSDQLRPALPPD